MRLLRGRIAPGAVPGGSVVTLGKFDGLHRGHRALLARTAQLARANGLTAVLLSFEPLPQEFLFGAPAYARLAGFATKWRLIAATGTATVLACLRFDAALAGQSARDFVRETLSAGLNAKFVVVGETFRFGHGRGGDVALLEEMARGQGFEVVRAATVCDETGPVSSSRVRAALGAHRLDEAAGLLGRAYRLWSRVRTGDALGRRLGFPTANLALGRRPPPLAGVYVVRVEGLPRGATRYGMASVGERPTVNGDRRLLEIYFPDFSGDLYGRLLAVDFLYWLRAQERYQSLDRLTAAIREDVVAGERWLVARGLGWAAD